jgi:hypothetical protein
MFIFSFYNTFEAINLEEYTILTEFASPHLILCKRGQFYHIFITNIKIPMVRIAKSYHFYEIQRNWFTLQKKVEPKLSKDTLLITLQDLTRQLHEMEILNAFLGKLKTSLPKQTQQYIRFMKIHEEDSIKYLYRDLERYGLITFCRKLFPSAYNNFPLLKFGDSEMEFQLPFCCTDIVTVWPIQIPSNRCVFAFDVSGGDIDKYNTMGMASVIILKSIDDFDYGSRISSIISTDHFFSKDKPKIRMRVDGFRGFWFHVTMKISYQGGQHLDSQEVLTLDEWENCILKIERIALRDVIYENFASQLLSRSFHDVDFVISDG